MAANDDEAGYGKPPKSHQFKKGQSGNPSGRKRGKAAAPVSPIDKVLKRKILVTVDGKPKRVVVVEAVVTNMVNSALKGNPIAAREVVRMETTRAKERLVEDPLTYQFILGDTKNAPVINALPALGIAYKDENGQLFLQPWVVKAALARLNEPPTGIDAEWVKRAIGKDPPV
jgi:hypothetical protein